MKNIRANIRSFLEVFSTIAIIVGALAIVSLFFSKTFPLWRILLGIIPLFAGIIIKKVIQTIYNIAETTEEVIETVQAISEELKNKNDKK